MNSVQPDEMTAKYLKAAIENAELKNAIVQKIDALNDWQGKAKQWESNAKNLWEKFRGFQNQLSDILIKEKL